MAMDARISAQLMIGNAELAALGVGGILERLARAIDLLGFSRLFLSVCPDAAFENAAFENAAFENAALAEAGAKAAALCRDRGLSIALWTMVLADTGRPSPAPALDFSGRAGRGRLGAAPGLGSGGEEFSFSCPTLALSDGQGPALAVAAALGIGADALFLDRIRYPSPANGLEFLGACACPACRRRYSSSMGEELPDLAALALYEARDGAAGAASFLRRGAGALRFRAETVAAIAARYGAAARAAGLGLGLDLFAPCLATIVGQDYGLLAAGADFVKAMLYCKSRGPACLPLELGCLVAGLEAGGVERSSATAFAAALLGLPETELARAPGDVSAALVASEYDRALSAMSGVACSPTLYAGVELVDQEGYATRISVADRDEYLRALGARPVTASWNLLLIPDAHLEALAAHYGGGAR